MLFEPNINPLPLESKPIFKELPFIEGETYKTRFQTGEMFTVEKIVFSKQKFKTHEIIQFWGYYVGREGLYPLGGDRLIARKEQVSNQQTYPHCHSYVM